MNSFTVVYLVSNEHGTRETESWGVAQAWWVSSEFPNALYKVTSHNGLCDVREVSQSVGQDICL
jgi:hypothetical protein